MNEFPDYEDYELLTCPQCGHMDTMDGFDVMGACDDNVFCTQCDCEFAPRQPGELFAKIHDKCEQCERVGIPPMERKGREYKSAIE